MDDDPKVRIWDEETEEEMKISSLRFLLQVQELEIKTGVNLTVEDITLKKGEHTNDD